MALTRCMCGSRSTYAIDRRREIFQLSKGHVAGWHQIEDGMIQHSTRQFHFIETWFLDPTRFTVCIRSRRILVYGNASPDDFVHKALYVWQDVLRDSHRVHFVHVQPCPSFGRATLGHFILIQETMLRHHGYLVQEVTHPTSEFRAVLATPVATVREIFHEAQLTHQCGLSQVCSLWEFAHPSHVCSTYENAPFAQGAFLQGAIRNIEESDSDGTDSDDAGHDPEDEDDMSTFADSTPSSAASDTSDDDAGFSLCLDHAAPGSVGSTSHKPEGNLGLRTGFARTVNDQTELGRVRSDDAASLSWGDIPLEFCVSDIFSVDAHTPTWVQKAITEDASPVAASSECISLMQRSRSRSRGSHNSSGESPREASSASDDDEDTDGSNPPGPSDPSSSSVSGLAPHALPTWRIVCSNMTEAPPEVHADINGPTIEQAAQALHFPARAIESIHVVDSLSMLNLDHVALVICVDDHLNSHTEAAVLFDAFFVTPGRPNPDPDPQLFHSFHLSRRRITRTQFLSTLKLTRIARVYPDHFQLRHNGLLWTRDDETEHTIQTGDHIEATFLPPVTPEHRDDLVDWVFDEGLTPWDDLLNAHVEPEISPTLPFVSEDPTVDPSHDRQCQRPLPATGSLGMLLNSWFISHSMHPTCEDSRVIMYSPNQPDWKQQIQRIWPDRFQSQRPFSVTWVTPPPEASDADAQGALPHVIIEQGFVERFVSAIITTKPHGVTPVQFDQAAFSLPERCPSSGIIKTANLEGYCSWMDCAVFHYGTHIREGDTVRRPSGQAYTVVVQPKQPRPSSEPASDLTTLLQIDAVSKTIVMPAAPHTEESSNAIASDQQAVPPTCVAPHPDDTCAQTCAHAGVTILSSTSPSPMENDFYVATYYLSAARMHTCPFVKYVRLHGDPASWKRTVTEAWIPLLDPAAPCSIHIVDPAPPTRSSPDSVRFHLIIYQHHRDDLRPTLVTTYEQGSFQHVALVLPSQVIERHVIFAAGLSIRCYSTQRTHQCSVSFRRVAIDNAQATRIPYGAGIVAVLHPLPRHVNSEACTARIEDSSLFKSPSHGPQDDDHLPWRDIPWDYMVKDVFGDQCQWSWMKSHRQVLLEAKKGETSRTVISLCDSIDPPMWTYVNCQKVCFLRTQLSDGEWHPPHFDSGSYEWHPATAQALAEFPRWDGTPFTHLQFYTDGSFVRKKQTAFAAAVLIVWQGDQPSFGGFRVFSVWGTPSSLRAERIAIMGALGWALQLTRQLGHSDGPQVSLHFDAQVAGFTTAGCWLANTDTHLVAVLTSLAHWLEARTRHTIAWCHVYSHQGDPWNEAADSACWFGHEGLVPAIDMLPTYNILTFDDTDFRSHQWLWALEDASSPFARHLVDGWLRFNVNQPDGASCDHTQLPMNKHIQVGHRAVEDRIIVKCSTANVLTLYPRGPARVRRLVRRYIDQQYTMWEVRSLHQDVRTALTKQGCTFSTTQPVETPLTANTQCRRCGQTFPTERQLVTHSWLAHGVHSAERAFMADATCLCCGTCFWTSARLQQHLHYSRRWESGCYSQLTWNFMPSITAATRMPDFLQGHLRVPATTTFGPHPDPALWVESRDAAEARIEALWQTQELPLTLPDALRDQVYSIIAAWLRYHRCSDDLSPETALAYLMELFAAMPPDHVTQDCIGWSCTLWVRERGEAALHPEVPGHIFASLLRILEEFLHPLPVFQLLQWRWRICDAHQPPRQQGVPSSICGRVDREQIPYWILQPEQLLRPVLHPLRSVPARQGVPIISAESGLEMWIIHLYSGRRRLAIVTPGWSTSSHGSFLVFDHVSSRLTPLFTRRSEIWGWDPTFSKCNAWPLEEFSVGPLRAHPARHGVVLDTFRHQMANEHPAPNWQQHVASVWKTPIHQEWIMALPAAAEHYVEQWRYGAVGVKPTTLRSLNLGDEQATLAALRTGESEHFVRPLVALQGKDSSGRFRTARAKEYPTDLSRGMAYALIKGLFDRQATEGWSFCPMELSRDDRAWMLQALRIGEAGESRAEWLPDYQPR
eukprot:Skav215212  [mRNA]  locus=scaffold1252:48299:57606:- [translate_table: standard]